MSDQLEKAEHFLTYMHNIIFAHEKGNNILELDIDYLKEALIYIIEHLREQEQ